MSDYNREGGGGGGGRGMLLCIKIPHIPQKFENIYSNALKKGKGKTVKDGFLSKFEQKVQKLFTKNLLTAH